MGGDSWSDGRGFKSQHWMLDGHFSQIFVIKIEMYVWKDRNNWKRGRDSPFLTYLFTVWCLRSKNGLLYYISPLCRGSGCGSVGRAVTWYTRVWIQTSAKLLYWTFVYCQLYWIDENKEKRCREWPLFLKKHYISLTIPFLAETKLLHVNRVHWRWRPFS